MKRVSFVVATGLDVAFDYAVPDDMVFAGGEIARVPFGKRELLAVHYPELLTRDAQQGTAQKILPLEKCKAPIQFFHQVPFSYPALSRTHRQFLLQLSQYYGGDLAAPLGAVVKMALPVEKVFDEKFIAKLSAAPPTTPSHDVVLTTPPAPSTNHNARFALNHHQLAAVDNLQQGITPDKFSVHLLHGITGSGKTAVYFEMMRSVLASGKKNLVLLPEISLSTQWREKFYEYFGEGVKLLEWHSHLSAKQRAQNFYHILRHDFSVLVGARSALLLPTENIGLIVVDEEHDASYKQSSGVRYHARDMAILRAKLEGCPIILSSATPSLESRHNVDNKKYHLTQISDRVLQKNLPTIKLIDLKEHPLAKEEFISAPLLAAIDETLQRGEQVLLFINRRGFAPITLCTHCGEKLTCRQCSSYLTHHATKKRYQCHRCDWFVTEQQYKNKNDAVACPHCQGENTLIGFGPGAERVMLEVAKKFPQAQVALATSDNIKKEADLKKLITDMTDKKIDIVVGTQLLAKGHDFPYLSLIGVIATDQLFLGEDPRAMEKAWQALEQVIGRAGRHQQTNHALALLQTYQPSEPTLQLLIHGQQQAFWQNLMAQRQQHHLPPFAHIALLTLSHKNENFVQGVAQAMKKEALKLLADQPSSFKLYGPAPAPMAKIRGLYRYRFLLTAARTRNLLDFSHAWLGICNKEIPHYKKIRAELDIDPQDFM